MLWPKPASGKQREATPEEGRRVLIHIDECSDSASKISTSALSTSASERAESDVASEVRSSALRADASNGSTPASKPSRNAESAHDAKDDDILLVSSSSMGNANDSGDNDDDVSREEDIEIYDEAILKIAKRGGILTLLYPPSAAEEEAAAEAKAAIEANEKPVIAVDSDDLSNSSSPSHSERCRANSISIESEDERQNEEHTMTDLTPASTQSDTRKPKQQRDNIRLTVLNMAAEAYKNFGVDVPDSILTQINDTRPSTPRSGSAIGPPTNGGNKTEAVKNFKHEEEPSASASQNTEFHAAGKIRVIRLSEGDEIHALPCQCALSLMGMTGQRTPSIKHTQGDYRSLPDDTTGRHGGSQGNSSEAAFSKHFFGFGVPIASNYLSSASFHPEDSTSSFLTRTTDFEKENTLGNTLVRTSSSRFADKNLNRTTKRRAPSVYWSSGVHDQNTGDEEKISPGASFFQEPALNRFSHNDHNVFKFLGYHEITLIRNKGCGGTANQLAHENFVEWSAVTIRCKDHDEMDFLIQTLRESAKATVVPFSQNPKAELKKAKEQEKREAAEFHNWTNRDANSSRQKSKYGMSTEDTSASSVAILPALSPEKNAERRLSEKSLSTNKKRDSKTFNKGNYCELCALHFTLLSRRHHCRKCDRSCCGDCSSVMLVRGGDECRYCNRCSPEILRSHAIHSRLEERRTASAAFSGKVHMECNRLRVGVMGKLPYWKTYLCLKPSQRPAVGRITVEVIEAMALPTKDFLNGKVDPYVRATITGYDRDMMWNLKEWLPNKQFSLCSGYCTATLSPQWRGSGRKGGELLTLPVISTSGAVLRLEVLHYDVLTNARGKDAVIGSVEIPLSDLPNANLRRADKDRQSYDGYCDKWYRLQYEDNIATSSVVFAKPIPSPHLKIESDVSGTTKDNVPGYKRKNSLNIGLHSLEEIGKRCQGAFIAPVEWIGTALQLDLPRRRPEALSEQHKTRTVIHVRIKLNASEIGDLLSHTWFPPIDPESSFPPFDPQTFLSSIIRISKLTEPYQKIQQFIFDGVIKWKKSTSVCLFSYFVLAVHIALFQYFLLFLHIHLIVFLVVQLWKIPPSSSNVVSGMVDDSELESSYAVQRSGSLVTNNGMTKVTSGGNRKILKSSSDLFESNVEEPISGSNKSENDALTAPTIPDLMTLKDSSTGGRHFVSVAPKALEKPSRNSSSICDDAEDTAKLGKAVNWLAKKLGENKGLEDLQLTLGLFARDLKNFNSLWDGTSVSNTRIAILVLVISVAAHLYIDNRLIYVVGSAIWYFSQCPAVVRFARMNLGFWRGLAKIIRRRELHELVVLEHANEHRKV